MTSSHASVTGRVAVRAHRDDIVRTADRATDVERATVLGGVKDALASLGGVAVLDPACAPSAFASIGGDRNHLV